MVRQSFVWSYDVVMTDGASDLGLVLIITIIMDIGIHTDERQAYDGFYTKGKQLSLVMASSHVLLPSVASGPPLIGFPSHVTRSVNLFGLIPSGWGWSTFPAMSSLSSRWGHNLYSAHPKHVIEILSDRNRRRFLYSRYICCGWKYPVSIQSIYVYDQQGHHRLIFCM